MVFPWLFYRYFHMTRKIYRSFNMYTSQLVVVGQCKQVDIIKSIWCEFD